MKNRRPTRPTPLPILDPNKSDHTVADTIERPPADPALLRRVRGLIDFRGGGFNADLVEDVIINALKLLTDVKDRGDVRVIRTAIGELRYAFRAFAPYAEIR